MKIKRKKKKKKVAPEVAEESCSLVALISKAVDGHGGRVQELMERDPGGGIVAALRLRVAAIIAGRVVEVEPQPALDAAVVVVDDGDVGLLVDDDRPPRRRRRAAGHGAVAPHVAAEGLADGELEAADGAAVQLGLGQVAVAVEPRLLVAGAVAAQRLERREHAVASLAHEHPLRPAAAPPAPGRAT
ncbi:unnamed protein product [Urochloa humidicola]